MSDVDTLSPKIHYATSERCSCLYFLSADETLPSGKIKEGYSHGLLAGYSDG